MPKGSLNVSLKGADDIFSTEESRQEQQREQVQQIPIDELFPFKNHPFKVLDDESMQRTVESVEQYGVLSPLIARPRPEGGYEIISGHRRQHAAQLAGLDALPVIVRNMDDDAAVLLMVDSNLQRENILPSERAFAYKMKLEALKNQGARSDLTSVQVAPKLSTEKIGEEVGMSKDKPKTSFCLPHGSTSLQLPSSFPFWCCPTIPSEAKKSSSRHGRRTAVWHSWRRLWALPPIRWRMPTPPPCCKSSTSFARW